MLVLSRQRDESIAVVLQLMPNTFLIIEFVVVDIRGDKVRLGVTAPKQVLVHRWENWEEARAELEREASSQGGSLVEIEGPELPPDVIRHLGIVERQAPAATRKRPARRLRDSSRSEIPRG